MPNEIIRSAARVNDIPHWQIAEALGIHESVFSRMLRHELADTVRDRILKTIDHLAKEKGIHETSSS